MKLKIKINGINNEVFDEIRYIVDRELEKYTIDEAPIVKIKRDSITYADRDGNGKYVITHNNDVIEVEFEGTKEYLASGTPSFKIFGTIRQWCYNNDQVKLTLRKSPYYTITLIGGIVTELEGVEEKEVIYLQ